MIEIPLTKGYVAIVDDDCPPEILAQKWCAHVNNRSGKVYVVRNILNGDGRYCMRLLHRAIMSAPAGFEVDHIDGDGLNNQQSNLRLCTRAENMQNQRRQTDTASGFKGVHRNHNKWRARIKTSEQSLNLGTFESKFDAARAYDEAAIRLFGEFARTNAALGLLEDDL